MKHVRIAGSRKTANLFRAAATGNVLSDHITHNFNLNKTATSLAVIPSVEGLVPENRRVTIVSVKIRITNNVFLIGFVVMTESSGVYCHVLWGLLCVLVCCAVLWCDVLWGAVVSCDML